MYSLITSRKATLSQNCQLNNVISNSKQSVDDFVGGVDFLELINECILSDDIAGFTYILFGRRARERDCVSV